MNATNELFSFAYANVNFNDAAISIVVPCSLLCHPANVTKIIKIGSGTKKDKRE